MQKQRRHRATWRWAAVLLIIVFSPFAEASSDDWSPMDALPPAEWARVEDSIDKGLKYVALSQRPDGSAPTLDVAQPAVTALCVMAFLARGHLPGEGPYGDVIDRMIDYVLRKQRRDGIFALSPPGPIMTNGHTAEHTAIYNHAISGLMLCEVYGMTTPERANRIRPAIEKALRFAQAEQKKPKRHSVDRGGWRYVRQWEQTDSDLSVTSWLLMFLRSAQNAGFDVPVGDIDSAMDYVKRCYDESDGSFVYKLIGDNRHTGRGMTGAGILSLSLGGLHNTPMAQDAGNWILQHPFNQYNVGSTQQDRFHYGAYYCSQAMLQLGGVYWDRFFPVLERTLVDNQGWDGAWEPETQGTHGDHIYGDIYTTALSCLALSAPYQLLPIYQR